MKSFNPRTAIKYTVFLGLGLVLFWLAFKGNDPIEIWNLIKQSKPFYLFLSAVSGYLAIVSRGIRWNILLKPAGYNPKTWNSIHAVNIGYFTNLALPRAGEVSRCTAMYKKEDIPVNTLIGTVVLERVIDMIILLILVGVSFLLSFEHINQFFINSGIFEKDFNFLLYIVLAGLLSVSLFFILRKKLRSTKPYQKVLEILSGVADGFKTIFKLEKPFWFFFHTALIWAHYFFMTYIAFWAFTDLQTLSLADGLFIMIVGGFGMIIPAPGGIGAYHAAVIAGLALLDVSPELSRSYAFTLHGAQTLMMILSGAIAFLFLSISKKA